MTCNNLSFFWGMNLKHVPGSWNSQASHLGREWGRGPEAGRAGPVSFLHNLPCLCFPSKEFVFLQKREREWTPTNLEPGIRPVINEFNNSSWRWLCCSVLKLRIWIFVVTSYFTETIICYSAICQWGNSQRFRIYPSGMSEVYSKSKR